MKTDAKDIIHLTKDTREGVSGIPVSLFAKDTIELSKSSEAAAKDFFDSNMNVNGVLSCKAQTNKQQMADLKKSWTQSGQSSSLHVLPFGVDYFAIGTDAAKGQLLESRQYQTVQICQFYGVPLQLIQSGDKLTYNSLEQLNLLFFQHTLQPYIVNIESEFSRKLFWDDDNLVVDMDEDAFLLRTDKSSTATYLSTLVGGGIMTVNESRKQLGLCEIENGDELHIAYSDANKAKIGNETPDINKNEAQN
jgi:HK97 family phage portal protein